MEQKIMHLVNNDQVRTDLPALKPGLTVKIDFIIKEDKKDRIQTFEGLILAIKGFNITKNIIVRKNVDGLGVERTFNVNSPLIKEIKILKVGRVRRARLYYIRKLKGKKARIKEKLTFLNKKIK